jgi:ribosome-associated heat shock protein Hsp15
MNSQRDPTENSPPHQQRLDQWLHTSRFFKTRKLAAQSILAGHIRVNNIKGKPGKFVRIGDSLTIRKNQQSYCITISGVCRNRPSAALAQSLYLESNESRVLREQNLLLHKQNHAAIRFDRNKPDKRERRQRLEVKIQHLKND